MIRSFPTARSHATLLIALMTSACASIPKLGPMPVARTAPIAAASRTLAGTGANWPTEGWWEGYQDPQLSKLIQEALADSPDLDVAAARLRTADGFVQKAGAALKPQIDGFASAQEVKLSKNDGLPVPGGWHDAGAIGLGISIDLDLWGKNRAALRAAKLDAQGARFDMEEARLALTTGIASAYAELAALYAQQDSLRAAVDIRGQTQRLVEQRVAGGLDNEAAGRQARARVEQTRASLAATDEAIGLAKNALAALIGTGPDRAVSIERPVIAALHAQGVPDNASIDLIGRRPDIAAARARADAAAQRIKEARADFFPNVNINGLIGMQAFGLGSLLTGNSVFGSAGPAISLPFFHGGAIQGQYRARRGQYDEAIALYDRQVIAALHETADVLTSGKMLASRLADSRHALADYEEATRLARLRYGQGLSTYLDVLTAEDGVLDSRLSVARLETRSFALDVALVRALGGGFHS